MRHILIEFTDTGVCEFNKIHRMATFLELGLKEEITKALTDLGYENPTVIQEKAVPQVIASTQDLKAFAQTGTGKTAAFSLPILEQIDANSKETQAIILSPTRELAVQIGNNIKEFSKYLPSIKVTTVYGGANIDEQIRSLKRGSQIVVGTPGRTVDLIKRRALKLGNIQWVVLDEADEMLNMGFKDELDQVLDATPETKQTLLFSATFPREVEAIARNYMDNPVEITSGEKNKGSDDVSHEFYLVNERTRYPALKRIADVNTDIYAIVFCRTRRETQEVANNLIKDGYSADASYDDSDLLTSGSAVIDGNSITFSGDQNGASPSNLNESLTISSNSEPLIISVIGNGAFDVTATWSSLGGRSGTVFSLGQVNITATNKLGDGTQFIELAKTPATLGDLGLNSAAIISEQSAGEALSEIDKALETVSESRAFYGARINQMSSAQNVNAIGEESLNAAYSRITDADFASETARLTQSQIIEQASVSVLMQARSSDDQVLGLLNQTFS